MTKAIAPFDAALVTIERKRFSVTQGEVLISYDGQKIEQYGDAIALRDGEWKGYSDEFLIVVAKREAIERGMAGEPAPLSPTPEQKRAERKVRSLDSLTAADTTISILRSIIVRRADRTEPFGPPAFDQPSLTALEYYGRKVLAIRAGCFRQRYGRDYYTSQRRHMRLKVIWWNEGYQDEADGSPLYRQPDAWSFKRWRAYCLGAETARSEIRADRDRAA